MITGDLHSDIRLNKLGLPGLRESARSKLTMLRIVIINDIMIDNDDEDVDVDDDDDIDLTTLGRLSQASLLSSGLRAS